MGAGQKEYVGHLGFFASTRNSLDLRFIGSKGIELLQQIGGSCAVWRGCWGLFDNYDCLEMFSNSADPSTNIWANVEEAPHGQRFESVSQPNPMGEGAVSELELAPPEVEEPVGDEVGGVERGVHDGMAEHLLEASAVELR